MLLTLLLSTGLQVSYTSYALPVMNVLPSKHIRGTAVLLTPNIALTAAHVIDGIGTASSVRCDTERISGVVVKTADEYDLALIELETPCTKVMVAKLAVTMPEVGDPITALGYPGGIRMVTRGIVSAVDIFDLRDGGIRFVILSDVAIFPGNSGGPVFGNGRELVGIATGRICLEAEKHQPECYGVVAPLSSIRLFLERSE